MNEQIEQRAQDLWERRLFHDEVLKIAHKYGFTVDEVHWLEWDVLPEKLQDHIREMAGAEIASGKASALEDTY